MTSVIVSLPVIQERKEVEPEVEMDLESSDMETEVDSDLEDDVYDGPCLICSESCQDELTIGAFIGGSFCLNRHLWSIFMLRNVLRFPKEEAEKLLLSSGRNPGEWCRLCGPCSKQMSQALIVHCEVLRLEKEMEEIRDKLEGKMKLSLCAEWAQEDASHLVERHAIREYYRDVLFPIEKDELDKGKGKGDGSGCSKEIPKTVSEVPMMTQLDSQVERVPVITKLTEAIIPYVSKSAVITAAVKPIPDEIPSKTKVPANVAEKISESNLDDPLVLPLQRVRHADTNGGDKDLPGDGVAEGGVGGERKEFERESSPLREIRKKEANRKAATRYRQRKKLQLVSTVAEEEQLQQKYDALVKERERLWREIVTIRGLLRNMLHTRRTRRHTISTSSVSSACPPIPTRRLGVIVSASVVDTCSLRPACYRSEPYHLGGR